MCSQQQIHATIEEMLEAAFSGQFMPRHIIRTYRQVSSVIRQLPASKNMSMEAEEYPLLTTAIKQEPEKTKTD
jgi:uncharacterized protein (DUF1697 family)